MKRFHTLWIVAVVVANVAFANNPKSAAQANNLFGLELYKKTTKVSAKGNKFLSPTSAYLALGMLLNGANGETKDAIAKALAVTSMTRDDFNQANLSFIDSLTSRSSDFKMDIANGVWSQRGSQILPDFVQRIEDSYRGVTEELDFATPEALLAINNWAKDKTHGKIPSIINQFPPLTRMVLANAMYFEGKWSLPFSRNTQNAPFTLANGTKVQVPMMSNSGDFAYAKLANAEVASLPFGRRGSARMVLIKPVQSLAAYETTLNAQSWMEISNVLNQKKAAYGTISMPSLELSYDSELNDQLKGMGMGVAFDAGRADFSEMMKERLSVSSVLQKTYLKVNEEGAIAAAVTAITAVAASIPPKANFNLVLDRPYVLAIEDVKTGAVLFMASIAQPEGGKLPAKPKPGSDDLY